MKLPALLLMLHHVSLAAVPSEDQVYNFDEHNLDLEHDDEVPYQTICYDELGEIFKTRYGYFLRDNFPHNEGSLNFG